jgi:citrate lyase synthetase
MEDSLGRLDRLTQEEIRMVAARGLKAAHEVDNKLQGLGSRVQQVANEMGDQTRSSSNHLASLVMKANSSHRGPITKGHQGLAQTPGSICKFLHRKPCSSRRYLPVVRGEQRLQRLESVWFIAVG